MSNERGAPGAFPRTTGLVWGVTLCSALAVVVGLCLWAFWGDPVQRRWGMGACLVVLLGCIVAVAARRRRTGYLSAVEAMTAERGSLAGQQSSLLPAAWPGRRVGRLRVAIGVACLLSALVGLFAMAGGNVVRPSPAEEIVQAGAVIRDAKITNVTGVDRQSSSRGRGSYTAVATVELKRAGSAATVPTTVKIHTQDEPSKGGTVPVLYAPERPDLGAVSEYREDLERTLAGKTLSHADVWLWGMASAAVGALLVFMLVAGFARSSAVSALRGRALRGVCRGQGVYEEWTKPAKDKAAQKRAISSIEIETSAGIVHFTADTVYNAVHLAVNDESVWVCWEEVTAAPGADGKGRERACAVLVSDAGWVLHGEIFSAEVQEFESATVALGSADAPVDPQRTVRLWWPQSVWPLTIPGWGLGSAVVALMCTAALLTEVAGAWRWAVAVAGAVALCGAVLAYSIGMGLGEEDRSNEAVGART